MDLTSSVGEGRGTGRTSVYDQADKEVTGSVVEKTGGKESRVWALGRAGQGKASQSGVRETTVRGGRGRVGGRTLLGPGPVC